MYLITILLELEIVGKILTEQDKNVCLQARANQQLGQGHVIILPDAVGQVKICY